MDKQTWIGIDIGKFKNSCSAPNRKVLEFKNNGKGTAKLLHHCCKIAPAHELFFVMEASGEYSNTCALSLLELADTRVAIVPPACVLGFIKSKIKRIKNDFADAVAIRKYAEVAQPSEWLPPTKEQQRLRDLQLVLAGVRLCLLPPHASIRRFTGLFETQFLTTGNNLYSSNEKLASNWLANLQALARGGNRI